ncbi:MAG: DUF4097 family beta strand repeat-containing protein [Bacillota bacterium]
MKTWEQTYQVAGGGTVSIDQLDGAVRIAGWENQQVKVVASWPGEGRIEDRLDMAVTANKISLAVKPLRSGFLGLRQDSLLDLELTVPFGTRCEVDSGSGPVTVQDTMGPAKIETGSGRVVVGGVSRADVDTGSGSVQARIINGPARIETGSGRIDLEMATGPVSLDAGSGSIAAQRIGQGLRAETASGSIGVADVEGRLDLESGSGSIAVSRVAAPEMKVETGSGSVRMQGLDVHRLQVETGSGVVEAELIRIHPDGDYRLETGSGRVTVALPSDAGLRLELQTHGRVSYGGLPVQVLRQEDEEISAIMGGGGPRLTVETGSGSINLGPCQGEGSPADHEVAVARLAELTRDDPALEQSEQLARITQMVQEGKLTVEEAEELLRALDGEEGQP